MFTAIWYSLGLEETVTMDLWDGNGIVHSIDTMETNVGLYVATSYTPISGPVTNSKKHVDVISMQNMFPKQDDSKYIMVPGQIGLGVKRLSS